MSPTIPPKTIQWVGGLNGHVLMIDQTRLPTELVMIECRDAETMWEAIKHLRIRGAPAIGIAAAMGAVLGIRDYGGSDRRGFLKRLDEICDHLGTSRPTGVNLFWALDRMRKHARSTETADIGALKIALLDEARRIRDEDAAMCRAIGKHGEALIRPDCGVLTHCNAGGLATAEYGTALAPLYTAHDRGRRFRVYVGETRPLLQGSRLTAWELQQAGIEVQVLCDSMVGALMKQGRVDLAITGADRIAASGDVANKVGTYSLAVLAQVHEVPFYVAAPSSTFDPLIPDGSGIPIEERDPDEIRCGFGRLTAPPDVPCYCPAFDVTPARLIRGIITERGLIQPVDSERITETLRD
ncbi:MAG: S-methyl-5-thioribose-1-phosphate isomerase [Phycisphaerales bacterium]|nr:MAG: S-methyl-5-thioribose-1-phosphate isomerase [Phycisphaerales bacterium]